MADDKEKRAKELMQRSNERKEFANQQEELGKAQIKNKVKPGQTGISLYKETLGQPYPVGKERVDIAKKYRDMAKKDSLEAVKLMKPAAIVSPVKRPSEAVMKKVTGKK
jgi:hypothetical protein